MRALRLSKNLRETGLEPASLLGTTTSRWRVCQFHHSRKNEKRKGYFDVLSAGLLSAGAWVFGAMSVDLGSPLGCSPVETGGSAR
jgi:hypothetical protein